MKPFCEIACNLSVSQFRFMTNIWHHTGGQSFFIYYSLLQILYAISKLLESPFIPVPKAGDETESFPNKVTIIMISENIEAG